MNFTANQKEAIDIGRLGQDACVVAGPGSGKTTVLVERYSQLVKQQIPPSRILAITFTEKAAANMKEKLANVKLGEGMWLGPQLENAYVSTVHGFCLRLIRENAVLAGIDPNVSILDERQGAMLQRRCLAITLDRLYEEQPNAAVRLMGAVNEPGTDLLEVYDAMRSAGRGPADLRNYQLPDSRATLARIDTVAQRLRGMTARTPLQREKLSALADWNRCLQQCASDDQLAPYCQGPGFDLRGVGAQIGDEMKDIREECAILRHNLMTRYHECSRQSLIWVLERFDQLYSLRKREVGMLDYSDLESFAIRLLRNNPEVRERMQRHFRQILMDEFQDTNPQQAQLLDLLRGRGNFYAVGDINQSIFGFRHANPEVFRAYSKLVEESGLHHVKLLENWRSRPEILLVAETILHDKPGIEQHRLKTKKELRKKKGPSIDIIAIDIEEQDRDADPLELEAQWVAHKIAELREEYGFRPGDMALLARKASVFDTFARVFEARGVDYEWNRRNGFFETREARDLTHMLRVISNPRDEISTAAVLRSPFVAATDDALFRLKLIDKNLGSALERLEEASLAAQDLSRLTLFRHNLKRWRDAQAYISIDRLLIRAMDESGYSPDPTPRESSTIDKFLALARESSSPLAAYVGELELMRESDAREAEVPLDGTRDAVHMITAHSAKGLEFPVVIVAAMHAGINRGKAQFSFTPDHGLGVKWLDPSTGEQHGDSFYRANKEEIERKEKEEANRLLYVALTRAEDHLVLSYSRKNGKASEWALLVDAVFPEQGVQNIAAPSGELFAARVVHASGPPPKAQMSFSFDAAPRALTLPRPMVDGQQDSAVNVTSLALFQACPRKYYLSRYLGFDEGRPRHFAQYEEQLPEDETPLAASDLGLQVHAILAGQAVPDASPEAFRLADVFTGSELGRRVARAGHSEREFSFVLAMEDVAVSGKIDLWFEEAGELILVDYKTDAAEDPEAYALQLQIYAIALKRFTGGFPDRACIHYLRTNKVIPIPVDADLAVQAVRQLADAQNSLRFPLKEGEHCQRCKFFHGLCPSAFQRASK